MKPKKIAVMYDCGTDKFRNLETRISIVYDTIGNASEEADGRFISAFTLDSTGRTVSTVRLDLTDEVIKELFEILPKQ